MNRTRGILWAALSSSTFGLAPLFTLLLLGKGYSPFEVLSYRWGIATLALTLFGIVTRRNFRLSLQDAGPVLLLSLMRAAALDPTVLTCYVMGIGALLFLAGGSLTGGVRLENDGQTWLYILGLALPATAVSNMALVRAIGNIGPTLTSIFGALEPLTAVVIGILVFGEPFTAAGATGILLIVAAVSLVVLRRE